jgi:CDP-diacylglycerol--serine O-phosphatidyltransferase
LRLARFNTQAGIEDKTYFQGLASPAAAGTLVTTVWFFVDQGISGDTVRWLILLETIVLGVLMFSRVRYFSFKRWPKSDRVPITWIFLAVVFFIFLAIDPPAMMMLTGLVYVLSGVLITLLGKRNWKIRRARKLAGRRRSKAPNEEQGESGE